MSDAPPPALGELARRAQAVIDACAKEQRAEHDDDPDAPYYAYLDGCEAEDAFRAACSPAVILQLVAPAPGGAAGGHLAQLRTVARRVLTCPCGDGVRQCDEADGLADMLNVLDEIYPALTPERPADAD